MSSFQNTVRQLGSHLANPAARPWAEWALSCLLVAGGFSVFAGVGERTREGNDLYKEMIESVRPPFSECVTCI